MKLFFFALVVFFTCQLASATPRLVLNGGLEKAAESTLSTGTVCRRGSTTRGVGTPLISICNDNEEEFGSLCYPKCDPGYEPVAGNICRQIGCGGLAGAIDMGASCEKPPAYGRGAGYAIWDQSKCEDDNGECEKWGEMWYPKCQPYFYPYGCCICTPECPIGYSDSGAHCFKNIYGRGVGVSRLGCPADKEQDAGLCYPPCPPYTHGVGPVCWGDCNSENSVDCGLFCTSTAEKCAAVTVSIVGSAAKVALSAVQADILSAIVSFIEGTVEILSPPVCQ